MRFVLLSSPILIIASLGVGYATDSKWIGPESGVVAGALLAVGLFIPIAVLIYQDALRREKAEKKFSALEAEAREKPAEARLAWDVARIKLESYLDRNIKQVSWIFLVTVMIMIFGAFLIGFGAWKALLSPNAINGAGLATISGIIVQFIGATFLVVQRSTMEQAKEYVVVLERINAVGMSINILDAIEGADPKVRNEARAGIARDLLGMYGIKKSGRAAKAKPKRPAA